MTASHAFATRYGAWAIVAGASEGVGRELARRVASNGVGCILLARRKGPLEELEGLIREESGVQCVSAAVDLAGPDALDRILAVVGDKEVGLYVSNAGADPFASAFLDREVGDWLGLVQRNVLTTVRCCHHFGRLMRQRRRGGLLLVGSGAAIGGAERMATYAGTKAFELRFAESLWAELRHFEVDVLCLGLATTDTPELRRLLAQTGQPVPRRMASPAHIADIALARLPRGPVYGWGPLAGMRAAWVRERVKLFTSLSSNVLGRGTHVLGR